MNTARTATGSIGGSRVRTITALAAVGAIALTACGSSDDGADSDGPESIRVNATPVGDQATAWMAEELGYYDDEELEVEIVTGTGGAEFIPNLMSGDMDFAFVNPTTFYVAIDQGLDIVAVAGMSESTGVQGDDMAAILVAADSDIQSAADLEGRSVAVNTLNSILLTTGRQSIRADGGDPDAASYVEIPLPDQLAQVEAGNVDAMVAVEPFVTQGLDAGLRNIASPYVDTAPNLATSIIVTTRETADERADVVESFVSAIDRASDYANENHDEARETIATYTQIDPDTLARITLPIWGTEINHESARVLAELQLEDGAISELPDLEAILPQ